MAAGAVKVAKVPVSTRALVQRINRALAADGERLKKTRDRGAWGQTAWLDLGDYYVIDLDRNVVVAHHVNLEGEGRKLGVLAEWEALAAEAPDREEARHDKSEG